MLIQRALHPKFLGFIAATLAVAVIGPALAQTATNFGTATLSGDRQTAVMQGYTGGAFSLSAIANYDQNRNLCLGYATSTPDHVITLTQAFDQLSVAVNSGRGGDTTLLIQGPNDRTVRCADDTGNSTDASIEGTGWLPGEYKVWVGSFDANVRYDYTLSVEGVITPN